MVLQVLQNLDPLAGLKKGTLAVVHACLKHSVVIELLDGSRHAIPRTSHKFSPPRMPNVTIMRHQLALALNWAGTVHRAQGDTLSRGLFDVRDPPFAHGHLYTGESRPTRRAELRFLVPQADIAADGSYFVTTNVVMHEILDWADS